MRLDTVVKFYSESERHYDPKTHGYVGGVTLVATVMANVTELGTNRSMELLGSYTANSKVVRLVGSVPQKWSYLMIDDIDKKYRLQTSRQTQKMTSLLVGEG